MSPLLPPKRSVPVARVHVPLTLSDTRTFPDEPYWANQPTKRSPARTGRLSETGTDVDLSLWLNAAPCTNVTAVAAAPREMTTAADAASPASTASTASTVKILLGTSRLIRATVGII